MSSSSRPYSTVLLFSGARDGARPEYKQEAVKLGNLLGEGGYALVYGGGTFGLMGAMIEGARPHGISVKAYIPDVFNKMEETPVPSEISQEIVMNLFERKEKFLLSSDVAISMPGGVGTTDEILEIMAANDIQAYIDGSQTLKPMILVNLNGFYNHLLAHFDFCIQEGFMHQEQLRMLHVADNAEHAVAILDRLNAEGVITCNALKKQG